MGQGSEGLYGECEQADEDCRELDQDHYYQEIENKKARYADNKSSQVGTTIRCANCSNRIVKKSYQTQFCSNKGRNNCKDSYWNCSTNKRLYRSQTTNR